MSSQLINMISASFVETIIMVLISGGIGAAIGIPLGILLFITDRKSFLPMPKFHFVLSIIINATRSVPFIILLVAIIPFTRLVVGSSIGTAAAIVPLTISVAPFIARIVETSLREVDKGLVEAAQAMGGHESANRRQGSASGSSPGYSGRSDDCRGKPHRLFRHGWRRGRRRPRRLGHPLRLPTLHA